MESSKNKLLDYFLICGLDLKVGLEPDYVFGESHCQFTPLDQAYKSTVLCHWPKVVEWNPFDKDAICLLSMPNGLHFRTQRHSLKPKFHSFVITKQDGLRYYGFSYIFYEVAPKKICSAMQILQTMHLAEISGIKKKTPAVAHTTHSLPRHFKKGEQTITLGSFYDAFKDTLYVMKSIALISQQAFIHAPYQILSSIYRMWKEQCGNDLENYIFRALSEIQVPSPGRSISVCTSRMRKIILSYPNEERDELPMFDFPIREFFQYLDIDTMMKLFTSALLENQILIRSSNYQKLMLVAETLNCLLFPFVWPHVYVPILPTSLEHFLDAPVPFIMGLARKKPFDIASQANLCFMDMDSKVIQLPEDLPVFPNHDVFAYEIYTLLDKFNIFNQHRFRQSRMIDVNFKTKNNQSPCKVTGASSSDNLLSTSTPDMFHANQSFEDLTSAVSGNIGSDYYEDPKVYMQDQRFNICIRDLFLNVFLHIFDKFEHFVIRLYENEESWMVNRDSYQNFDKASFLSDQPEANCTFLSRFLETQMFTNFVDNKIQSSWSPMDRNLAIFERSLKLLREKHGSGDFTTCKYQYCGNDVEIQHLLECRLKNVQAQVDLISDSNVKILSHSPNVFPTINIDDRWENAKLAHRCSIESMRMVKPVSEARPLGAGEKLSISKTACAALEDVEMSPAVIAQTNWNFVEKLLKECKNRTKKMLVAKLGFEAVELGHRVQTIMMEENTLIVGLCELIERIWSHGCQNTRGNSALWAYVKMFQANEEKSSHNLSQSTADADDAIEGGILRLHKLPVSVVYDIACVEKINEIKSPIGLAKAWIRLSIEKKLLAQHFRALMSNKDLLKSHYKRYAFVRCEEEKEQFLFHLLSLNAVDYSCFTNTYANVCLPYRVLVYYSKSNSAFATPSKCWLQVSGNLGESEKIVFPAQKFEFVFECKNLGMLTLVRIGQVTLSDGLKLLLERVIIRCEATGRAYGWLGRGVDDDACQRLLLGKPLQWDVDVKFERGRSNTLQVDVARVRSPSVPPAAKLFSFNDVRQNLENCVTNLVKYYYGRGTDENFSFAESLCGENGLVRNLERVFLFGYKSARFFGRNLNIWDYIVRAKEENAAVEGDSNNIVAYFRALVSEINEFSDSMGKEGLFQVLICVAVRDFTLSSIVDVLSKSKVTADLYNEYSFFRNAELMNYLRKLLEPLNDLHMKMENSLTLGVEIAK